MKKIKLPLRRSRKPTRKEIIKKEIHGESFVWWNDLSKNETAKLKKALRYANGENDMQKFLEKHPRYLVVKLGGGHGRWVIPKKRLGSEHVTDFIIGEKHSYGYDWMAVELEPLNVKMFTRKGDPSQRLIHAIRQIQDWRAWLTKNQNYASRPSKEKGLELIDIDQNIHGLILIGRRSDIDPKTNALRKQMIKDLKIEIHSYDYLLDSGHFGTIKDKKLHLTQLDF